MIMQVINPPALQFYSMLGQIPAIASYIPLIVLIQGWKEFSGHRPSD
jgi:hypothetical protein